MKRTLTLILAILMLSLPLTSCSPAAGAPGDGSGAVADGGGGLDNGTTNNGENDADDVPRDEYGFTIFPDGNYLADPMFDTDDPLPDYDANNDFILIGNYGLSGGGLCSTDDTIYYIIQHNEKQTYCTLMYRDKKTGISGPLCGKPECLHNDRDCNAYISTDKDYLYGLYVYDRKLYLSTGSSVINMELDGTNRGGMGISSGLFLTNGRVTNSAVPHRGYEYYFGTKYDITDGVVNETLVVAAQPLDGGEGFKIIERAVPDNTLCQVRFAGNDVYILVGYPVFLNEIDTVGEIELYRWDSKTRRSEVLYYGRLDKEDGETFDSFFRNFTVIPKDGIYLQTEHFLYNEEGDEYGSHHIYDNCGLSRYSFETGDMEHFVWIGSDHGSVEFIRDGKVYSSGYGSVFVHDLDGNLLLQGELYEPRFSETAGYDDEYIYQRRTFKDGEGYIALPLDGGAAIILE